jgi:prepilin-type N-terminal cleavage/methylation domain-containing protein
MKSSRAGFTLFELILAIALSAILLTIIGMAINLFLSRVDADRTRVEEAQLARSVLSMIADDIHGASIYKPQDTTAIAQLMIANAPFDVDSIDKERQANAGSPGIGGTTSATKIAAIAKTTAAAGGSTNTAGTSTTSGSSSSSSSSSANGESDNTMPLGLNGTGSELYVDATQLPRQEELFSTTTGYTNAPSPVSSGAGGSSGSSGSSGDVNPPADLKTIHYFIRPGATIEPGSAAATSLSPQAQASAGGLVRQETARTVRVFAESQAGDSSDSGGVLIAPEVVQIQFRYFDGSQLTDEWDMRESSKLPTAIEVCVWLKSARAATNDAENTSDNALQSAREYRQVVFLPMAALSAASAASAASATQSSTDSSSTSSSSTSSSSSSSTSGSAFGDQ